MHPAASNEDVGTGWRAVPGVTLHWKSFAEEYVVYNSGSGDTHLLDPVAALLVREITEFSESEELIQRVAALLAVPADAEFRTSFERAVTTLGNLKLIEKVDGAAAPAQPARSAS